MRRIFACTTALLLSTSFVNAAMTDADCEAAFKKADINSDGIVTEAEGAQYLASMRIANKTATDGKIQKSDFMMNCKSGVYDSVTRTNDPGAPLAGANSFTEAQARDRALAAGYTTVSALAKDDKGVWRGTAMGDGKNVKVAIDFKGNVVAN